MHRPSCAAAAALVSLLACAPPSPSDVHDRSTPGVLKQAERADHWSGYIVAEDESAVDQTGGDFLVSRSKEFSRTVVHLIDGKAYFRTSRDTYGVHVTQSWDGSMQCYQRWGEWSSEKGDAAGEATFSVVVDPSDGTYSFSAEPAGDYPHDQARWHHWEEPCNGDASESDGFEDEVLWLDAEGSGVADKPYTLLVGESDDTGAKEEDGLTWSTHTRWLLNNDPNKPQLVVFIGGYDSWRPEGGEDEKTPGNRLTVTAKMLDADGGGSWVMAETIKFELLSASHVPGVSMNWPAKEKATTDADLQFLAADNPGLIVSGEHNERVETAPGLYDEATAVLSSFDWGGYGTLKVTATLADGTVLEGVLDGEGDTLIKLPKRSGSSFVADSWKRANGVKGRPDNDDSEDIPRGDGHTGDGLSLYEEYRGFRYEDAPRKWVSGNPRRKDLFIYSTAGAFADNAFDLVEQASGLRVHPGLGREAYDGGGTGRVRVLNFNLHEDPSLHLIDQHLLFVREGDEAWVSQAVSFTEAPGTPRDIASIETARIPAGEQVFGRFNPKTGEYRINDAGPWTSALAHEVFHGTNIYHHGTGDQEYVTWSVENGGIVETATGGSKRFVDLRRESTGGFVTPSQAAAAFPRDVYVSRKGGQHSGDDSCLMRSSIAEAVEDPGNPFVRWVFSPPEKQGLKLCTSAKGTGVNAAGRSPISRNGDAQPGRGACAKQLCVNDTYFHPGR